MRFIKDPINLGLVLALVMVGGIAAAEGLGGVSVGGQARTSASRSLKLSGGYAVRPDVLSITFTDLTTAQEYRDEALSNGERVTLEDLGPSATGPQGQRWWLHSD